MNKCLFLLAGVLTVSAVCAAPYKTVIKGALLRERLDAKTVRDLRAAELSGVEINLMVDPLPTLDEAHAARRLAEAKGIEITSVIGGWFAFNEPEKRAAELEKAKRCITLTKAYGASVMLIVPVGRYPDNGPKFPPFREISYSWNPATLEVTAVTKGDNAPYADYIRRQNAATAAAVAAMRELIPLAAEKGVILALENVGIRMWMKPDYYHALVKSFNSPWVKFYFDMGNSINVGDPCDWIDEFGADIVKLHLKDDVYDASRPWGQRMVAIGEGVLDFKKIRDALERINYNGWVVVESDFQSDADHGKILRRFAAGEPVWPKNR